MNSKLTKLFLLTILKFKKIIHILYSSNSNKLLNMNKIEWLVFFLILGIPKN